MLLKWQICLNWILLSCCKEIEIINCSTEWKPVLAHEEVGCAPEKLHLKGKPTINQKANYVT